MNAEVLAISKRIRELRDILSVDVKTVAEKISVDTETYEKFEKGETDIPIGSLYAIADVLGVDATVLLTGDTPRMNRYSVTRKGGGVTVERYPGYNYQSLSFNFKNRIMDPLLVTLDSKDEDPPTVTHAGQEFNYVLEGSIRVTLGDKTFVLSPGDSIYFDPSLPHRQASCGGKAVFLTIIKE